MVIDNDTLYLYNLTLRNPSMFHCSIIGQFLGEKKSQEIVLVNSTLIEIWRPDSSTGKIERLHHQRAFGIIQSVDKIRSVSNSKDLLVITSDSGNLVVAEFDVQQGQFVPIVQEPHSKNGLRRLTPGEYLAVDPYNRAILISAVERNKLVYKVQSGEDNKFELSSPLESSTRSLLTLKLVALDTTFENPKFAAIECDYGHFIDSQDQFDPDTVPLELNYYELDQGLNYLVRSKSQKSIPHSTSQLIPLPGHIGGVLAVCDDLIFYDHPKRNRLYLPLPLRDETNKTTINGFFLHKLKRNNFFVILQSTLGDLFKVEIDFNEEEEKVTNITAFYFDTIPLCNSINILKNGFLFANVYNNNKLLYQFENLDATSRDKVLNSDSILDQEAIDLSGISRSFTLQGLRNLTLIDVLQTLEPVTDCSLIEVQSKEMPDPIKKLVTLSSHSYVKTLTHGVESAIIVESPVRIIPTGIFTTKLYKKSTNDQYLVITSSLSSSTLVLSIGQIVEEEEDSKFVLDQSTLAVQQVGVSSVVQIHTNGVRHIKHLNHEGQVETKVTDWFSPAGISIVKASANNQQVIVGLSNRELCYFEIDASDDQLVEYQERVEMSGIITSLAIGLTDTKTPFAMVGLSDETVQIVSLLQHNCLETISLQAVSAISSSIVLQMQDDIAMAHIGLESGLYVRSMVDNVTGKLSDTRVQYIGSKPVELSGMKLNGSDAILAISSRPWIGYYHNEGFKITPLLKTNISSGSSFYSEDIGGEGIVGISKNNLVIFTVGDEEMGFNKDDEFSVEQVRLRYTPRKLEVYKEHTAFVSQSEYNTKGPFPKNSFELIDGVKNTNVATDENNIDQDYYEAFGYDKVDKSWASCVQMVDLISQSVQQTIEFSSNENIVSSCIVEFGKKQDYLILGVTQGQTFLPNKVAKSFLYTFKITTDNHIAYVHKTEVDNVPSSMSNFNNMVLVGMGNFLRLYDLGQRQLLRKCSTHIDYLVNITTLIHQDEDQIVIGDSENSTTFISYDHRSNTFSPISNDTVKRKITTLQRLDNDTVIGSDKFGNIFVSRLPEAISKESVEGWSQFRESYLNASPSRLKNLCEFYSHDIVTSFMIGSLNVGGNDSIIYSGLQGTIGILTPVITKHEVDLFCGLELIMRKLFDINFVDFDKDKGIFNLLGKDHLKFRGYYNPSKNVVDGDFIEQYSRLTSTLKIRIANELDRSPKDIEKKIAEMRNRSAF